MSFWWFTYKCKAWMCTEVTHQTTSVYGGLRQLWRLWLFDRNTMFSRGPIKMDYDDFCYTPKNYLVYGEKKFSGPKLKFSKCVAANATRSATKHVSTPSSPYPAALHPCWRFRHCIVFRLWFSFLLLSISSFNSIISSCFGWCCKCAHLFATRLDSQFFYH